MIICDKRIIYVPNKCRRGAAGNLDQAFNSGPLVEGTFAFVLEDENRLLPNFIESNIYNLDMSRVDLLLRNQLIYDQLEDGWYSTSFVTKDRLHENGRIYSPLEVHAAIFLNDCIANGGLFWRANAIKTYFQIGPSVCDSGVQEFCRTVQIRDDLLYASDPLGIWTRSSPSSARPSTTCTRSTASRRGC